MSDDGISSVAGAFAVMAIRRHLEAGGIIEIPSLDLVFGSPDALDRHEAIRDRAIAFEHARICAGLVWPYRRPRAAHWRLSERHS